MSAAQDYSGIVLSQSVSSWPLTFQLPADYARGDSGQPQPALVPPLTGFQLYLTVASGQQATAAATWSLQRQDGANWDTLASGTTTGTAIDGASWFSVYFEPVAIDPTWLTSSYRLTITLAGGASNATRLRLLAGVADSGTDFLGNVYRSALVRSEASNVSVVGNINAYWLSAPSPSQFGVHALYLDERSNGQATVLDRVTITPVTPGVYAHIYYSNDPTGPGVDPESWDNLLWTPVYKPIQLLRKQTYPFPEPIVAKYLKVEFTNLQPHSYNPGNFQVPTTFRKYPRWVLDYFLAIFATQQRDLLSSGVDITYDALDLAYTYYKRDILQAPRPPALSEDLTARTLNFFQQDGSLDQVDPETLGKIRIAFQPFTSQPALLGRFGTVLGNYAASNATSNYSVEVIQDAIGDTTVVSNFEREPLIVEKSFPQMFFYLPCRHTYRISQAMFEKNIGYFAGVQELVFHRDLYTGPEDTIQYNEPLGDGANLLINDWNLPSVVPDWQLGQHYSVSSTAEVAFTGALVGRNTRQLVSSTAEVTFTGALVGGKAQQLFWNHSNALAQISTCSAADPATVNLNLIPNPPQNGGGVAVAGTTLYYTNWNTGTSQWDLYRANRNGTGQTLIVSNASNGHGAINPSSLATVGNYLFFGGCGGASLVGRYDLGSATWNGSWLSLGSATNDGLNLCDGKDGNLYALNINFTSGAHLELWRIDPATGATTLLTTFPGIPFTNLCSDGTYLYYAIYTGGGIGRSLLDGSGYTVWQTFPNAEMWDVCVASDGLTTWLYYSLAGNITNTLGRMKLDGTSNNPSWVAAGAYPAQIAAL